MSEQAMLENLEYLESNKPAFPIQLVQLDDGYPVRPANPPWCVATDRLSFSEETLARRD